MGKQTNFRGNTRAPLEKLRKPVRQKVEEIMSWDNASDRGIMSDEAIMGQLNELQTKQATKVLDAWSLVAHRSSGSRIQNKGAYLMSLIQSCKRGQGEARLEASVTACKQLERFNPSVRKLVEAIFDPMQDRVVYEDKALMDLLVKVPEEHAVASLKKYRATVQHRGREAINNKCGYLIGFLKQYQGLAPSETPESIQNSPSSRAPSAPASLSRDSRANSAPTLVMPQAQPSPVLAAQSSAPSPATQHPNAAANTAHTSHTSSDHSAIQGSSTPAHAPVATVHNAWHNPPGSFPGPHHGRPHGWRPINVLSPAVRAQLERMFGHGKDRGVLDDVGLMKQLARLGEDQALAALKNYREAAKHRQDINNKSAYLMGILRGYIEGTTPLKMYEEGMTRDGEDTTDEASDSHLEEDPGSAQASRSSQSHSLSPQAFSSRSDATHTHGWTSAVTTSPDQDPGCGAHPAYAWLSSLQGANPPAAPPGPPASVLISNGDPLATQLNEAFRNAFPSSGSGVSRISGYTSGGGASGGDSAQQPPAHARSSPVASLFAGPSILGGEGMFGTGISSLLGPEFAASSPVPQQQPVHAHPAVAMPNGNVSPPAGSRHGSFSAAASPCSKPGAGGASPTLVPAGFSYAASNPNAGVLSPPPREALQQAGEYLSEPASLSELLSELKLEKYGDTLAGAEVDLDALRLMTDNDLRELGIPKGPRIKLLHAIGH